MPKRSPDNVVANQEPVRTETAASLAAAGRVTTMPKDKGEDRSSGPDPRPTGHVGWIVPASLATGLLAGLLLVAAPFIPAEESELTGTLLCGFALGWAMLAVLSTRFSDQPQRWAAAPAVFA